MTSNKNKYRARRQIGESQNWRCCYCGTRCHDEAGHPDCFTLDHLKTRASGGTWRRDNLVGACACCNTKRGRRDPFEFFAWRQAHPRVGCVKPTRALSFGPSRPTLGELWFSRGGRFFALEAP